MLLLRGASLRVTLIATAVLIVVYLAIGWRSAQLDHIWRVDEGQRIAEGYFWRLLRAGDFTSPDWFRQITIRSHPPVSKYFFGAAVTLAGVPPPADLRLARAYDEGAGSSNMPAAFAPAYLPMRRPARLASFVVNVLTAAIVFFVLLRGHGAAAALIGQLLLFRQYLFNECLFYARSDTVQTFCATATLLPLVLSDAAVWPAAISGTFAALAFQTRLNGGVALLMGIAFLVVRAARERRTWVAIVVMFVAFVVVSVAINPTYWAEPRVADGVPPSFVVHRPLPVRIVARFVLQVRDLRELLNDEPSEWRLPSLPSRVAFTASSLFSGKAGIAIATGLLLALGTLRWATASERATIAWALCGIVIVAVWIPLRWDIYLLMIVPASVIAASVGFRAALALASRGRSDHSAS